MFKNKPIGMRFIFIAALMCLATAVESATIEKRLFDYDYPESETVRLRVFTTSGANRTIDVKNITDRISTSCDSTRPYFKLIVHGFAEAWNMNLRWNWVESVVREMSKSNESAKLCIIVVDWEELAKGGKYIANYWKSMQNMNLAAELMSVYFSAHKLHERNVHCIGFSLGAHMCGIFYKTYQKKYSIKMARITGLDPAGPFFAGKPLEEKLHYTDAQLVDIVHTSQQFGLVDKHGHMDFYPDSGPSGINACGDILNRYENDDNVILFEEDSKNGQYQNVTLEEKEFEKPSFFNSLTPKSVQNMLKSLLDKIKNFSFKPKRVFTKVHQFFGCSHLMAVRFFIYSINDCEYKAVYCSSRSDFEKNRCARYNLDAFPRMGYYADRSDQFYQTSFGNYFLYTMPKPPYCMNANSSRMNDVKQFYKYFFDNLRPKKPFST